MFSQQESFQSNRARLNSLLMAAEEYLARGWSCIPLWEKRPALARWKEYQSRPPTFEELHHWFASRATSVSGIGIVTGRVSGLVVIDCDSMQDAEYWLEHFPKSPLMVSTGGGGLHIYYQTADDVEIRNRAKLGGRKIDIRGEGGYAAAPPSRHGSGRHYLWESCDMSAPLPVFQQNWVADNQRPCSFSSSWETKKIRKAVSYIARIHAVAGEGGHNATFRAACKLRDTGLAEADALAILSEWNETNACPPWSARELIHKVRSAYAIRGNAEGD
jgi:hypothetical protein